MGFYVFLNEVVFAFIEGIIILLIFMCFTDNKDFIKINRARSLIFLAWFTLANYCIYKYVPGHLNTPVYMIFTIILLSLATQSGIISSIIVCSISTFVIVPIEAIALVAAIVLMKNNIAEILANPEIKFLLSLATKVMELGLIFLILRGYIKLPKLQVLKKGTYGIPLIMFQTFIISILIISTSHVSAYETNTISINIVQAVILLLFVVTSFLEYKERERLMETKNQLLLQEQYSRNLEVVVDAIRKEKHDFINHLNVILAMCAMKAEDASKKIENYVRQLSNNLGSSYKYYNTGNIYIDGLLAVKSNYAHENNIHFDVGFDALLSEIDIDDVDLTSIMGNIIDNAFDAVLSNSGKEKSVVSIYTYIYDNKYNISISNNGPAIPPKDLQKIFEKGYSTKQASRDKTRGFGLFIAKQLVSKHNGKIALKSSEEGTEFLIQLGVKNKLNNMCYLNSKSLTA